MRFIQAEGRTHPSRSTIPIGCAFVRRTGKAAGTTLDELYRRERPALLRYLRKNGGSEDAEDLLQEVFVRASTSQLLDELRNPGGYLCRIAQTVLIDHARRRGCRIRVCPLEDGCEPSYEPQQEDGLLASALDHELNLALNALPKKTRMVFRLNRFDRLTYRQIERRLGISEAAVGYHMMKALGHLRAVLKDR